MTLTFTKPCGFRLAIDAAKIVSVDDMGDFCVIDTDTATYEVQESFEDIVSAINTLKMQHVMKFYN